jgi:putative membrane protein insertion efficiency factor
MIAKALIGMVRWYQKHISPAIGPHCKYMPTCSQYMIDAVTKYGALKGGLMGIWRILRCNPFSKGGYDPVR